MCQVLVRVWKFSKEQSQNDLCPCVLYTLVEQKRQETSKHMRRKIISHSDMASKAAKNTGGVSDAGGECMGRWTYSSQGHDVWVDI